GEGGDRLVEIATPGAATAHLHEMRSEGGMARMRGLGTLEIPPHGRIELAPGGLHIMLMGLTQPLKAGETLPLHLRFLKAGERDVAVAIRALDAP
ncbi:MAG: copper chaperone PCu(A)C, partial [Alphaproteobacteria bacterium]